MKTVLVTVSDDRFGRKEGGYKACQEKITQIIKNNPQLGIEEHVIFDTERLMKTVSTEKSWHDLMKNADPSRNGRVYKPYAIVAALNQLDDGDFLIYNDCSPEIWMMPEEFRVPDNYKLHIAQGLCVANGGILTPYVRWSDVDNIKRSDFGKHNHTNFTLNRCIRKMGMWDRREDFMCASGMIVIQKTAKTMAVIEEWFKWNLDAECCAFGDPNVPDDYSYWSEESHAEFGKPGYKMGHRHDQSILSLLLTHNHFKFVDIPVEFDGVAPYNFLQYCRLGVNYEWVNGRVDIEHLKGTVIINHMDVELNVYDRRWTAGGWVYKVGKSEGACHEITSQGVKSVKQTL